MENLPVGSRRGYSDRAGEEGWAVLVFAEGEGGSSLLKGKGSGEVAGSRLNRVGPQGAPVGPANEHIGVWRAFRGVAAVQVSGGEHVGGDGGNPALTALFRTCNVELLGVIGLWQAQRGRHSPTLGLRTQFLDADDQNAGLEYECF